jgi:hypothetical protein
MEKTIKKIFLFLLFPSICLAATGDELLNCSFDGPGSTPVQVWTNCGGSSTVGPLGLTSGTIVTGGHDGGKAIKFYYPNTGGELFDPFWSPVLNKREITVVYWEKYDVAPTVSDLWNVKSSRAYTSASTYMAGMISRSDGGDWQQTAPGSSNTLTVTDAVTSVANWSGYCNNVSGDVWNCPEGRIKVSWAPGTGTSWHKIRYYLKAPSSSSATDGITMLWIDENLIYSETNIKGAPQANPYITGVSFHPSDDFYQGTNGTRVPFNHFYDNVTIYEGYVPPQNTVSVVPPQLGNPSYSP